MLAKLKILYLKRFNIVNINIKLEFNRFHLYLGYFIILLSCGKLSIKIQYFTY